MFFCSRKTDSYACIDTARPLCLRSIDDFVNTLPHVEESRAPPPNLADSESGLSLRP